MDLGPYVEEIHRQVEVAAEAGGDEARALADRLVAPLDAAIRLALQDALAAAVEEITVELAPGSVELRLRGRDPEFVVTLPPADPSLEDRAGDDDAAAGDWPVTGVAASAGGEGDESTISRINLRLPEHLKARIEQAAAGEGLSVNAWLVRAAAAALERSGGARRRERGTHARRPAVHGLGALDDRSTGGTSCPPSIPPNRSPSPWSSASATSGSTRAIARTPWSTCARATPARRPT